MKRKKPYRSRFELRWIALRCLVDENLSIGDLTYRLQTNFVATRNICLYLKNHVLITGEGTRASEYVITDKGKEAELRGRQLIQTVNKDLPHILGKDPPTFHKL